MEKCIIIGAGAAGCFAALACAETYPNAHIQILEKTKQPLAKVRISGGGRCNVTHACFDPKILCGYYPRGYKELLGPFHRFGPADTVEWFKKRGVELKTERDGRIFPITDKSETIIDCFLSELEKRGVELILGAKIDRLPEADALILTTGSSRQGYEIAREAGHTIVPTVPSLFSFNVPSSPLLHLAGVVAPNATVWLEGGSRKERGPLLLTHWGFSGPPILKLSAWEARFLHQNNYRTTCMIEWGEDLPRRLRREKPGNRFLIEGKTTYKKEFVTCGGISLKEVNFKTMESRICPRLFFAGEILDIDGVTGGFNFQNAWTTGWISGTSAMQKK
ncbi:MAG: aminoacetone oxidase family FAD-binding enzyme [Chlamydiales bacterium]|nr:aminoacetone oxidase family FAD-binding enzyme [Chlamydiales bacterium]